MKEPMFTTMAGHTCAWIVNSMDSQVKILWNTHVADVIIGGTGYNFKRKTGNEIKREAPSNV
jgi:hypothetical protein